METGERLMAGLPSQIWPGEKAETAEESVDEGVWGGVEPGVGGKGDAIEESTEAGVLGGVDRGEETVELQGEGAGEGTRRGGRGRASPTEGESFSSLNQAGSGTALARTLSQGSIVAPMKRSSRRRMWRGSRRGRNRGGTTSDMVSELANNRRFWESEERWEIVYPDLAPRAMRWWVKE